MDHETFPSTHLAPGPLSGQDAIDWAVSPGLVGYETALQTMQERVQLIAEGRARELIWLLEHPPLYSAGTSAKAGDLLDPHRFPVHWTGRGGELTYHGPGQRVVYVMLDLKRRFGGDIRAFVGLLEQWVIRTLADFGIKGETRPGRVGVWVQKRGEGGAEAKIAAIGVRVRRGISFHGLSLNVAPELAHYDGIVACGLSGFGVTSLAELGTAAHMKDVDISLRRAFEALVRPVAPGSAPASSDDERAAPRER
jgi:lipoyl(octanoyl) transferase